jgi:hypothetical protein
VVTLKMPPAEPPAAEPVVDLIQALRKGPRVHVMEPSPVAEIEVVVVD